MAADRVVVVGASLGGLEALSRLVEDLPADLAAPMLVVQHIGSHPSQLPALLSRRSALPVSHATDGEAVKPGHVHVAPPDHHMLLEGARLRLNRGARQNHARPAIDPLFLSAALSRGPDVIGVVLTGQLDDGTSGLQAIKRCGGVAVVQDPADAQAPSMPRSALRHVAVDHRAPLRDMAALLARLVATRRPAHGGTAPAALVHEHELDRSRGDPMEHLRALGRPSSLACPECGGGLWKLDAPDPQRYRCHTGHRYTARTLLDAIAEATNSALWHALRALEEEAMLLDEMAVICRARGDAAEAQTLGGRAAQVQARVAQLRRFIEDQPSIGADELLPAEPASDPSIRTAHRPSPPRDAMR